MKIGFANCLASLLASRAESVAEAASADGGAANVQQEDAAANVATSACRLEAVRSTCRLINVGAFAIVRWTCIVCVFVLMLDGAVGPAAGTKYRLV